MMDLGEAPGRADSQALRASSQAGSAYAPQLAACSWASCIMVATGPEKAASEKATSPSKVGKSGRGCWMGGGGSAAAGVKRATDRLDASREEAEPLPLLAARFQGRGAAPIHPEGGEEGLPGTAEEPPSAKLRKGLATICAATAASCLAT